LAKGADYLGLPAIAERDERIAIGRDKFHHRRVGGLLGRPGHTREALEAERGNLGSQVFSAQYQQSPTAPEGNLIRPEWFLTYDEQIERSRFHYLVQSWDTGLSDQPTADYSACTTWGLLDRKLYLLDVFRQQLAFPELERAVLLKNRIWRPDKIIIEDAGTGTALWQQFRFTRKIRPVMMRPDVSKEERVIGITGLLESGACLLPAEAPWLDEFLKEIRAFPFGRNDDQVDSMSQFLTYYLRYLRTGRSMLVERHPESGRKLRVERKDRVTRR
jgi:predicted phage terminase large subunit-like protein